MMASSEFPFRPSDRIWGYGRDSGGARQDKSVAQQHQEIEELCQRHGVIAAHLFGDKARIGSTTVGRDALEDLLYLAKQNPRPVDGIVFWSFARLARDQIDSQFVKAELRHRGYILYSMTDDIPDGEFGPVIEALIDWKNERFLKDLSREVQRGLGDLAKQGYAPGGFPPRGYLADEVALGFRRDGQPHIVSRWVPDPELGPRVTRAFDMRAVNTPYLAIHEATRVMGTVGSYVTMFRNRTYLGIRKCGDLEIENAHEPLVSREVWDAVQATLRERPEKGARWPEGKQHPMRARTSFLLSGLAVCAECGAAMVSGKDNVSNGRQSAWPYYLCGRKKREGWHACPSGKIGARGPEEAVLQAVTQRVLTSDFVSALVAEVNALMGRHMPSVQGQTDQVRRQLAGIDDAIGNLLDLAERFGAASAGPRLAEREAERALLQERLRELAMQQEAHQATISLEMVRGMLTEMHGTLIDGNLQAKRALLSKVVHKVVMSATGAELVYTFPLRG